MSEFWRDFESCAKHCWCAYSPNSDVIRDLKAEHIVEAFICIKHEHGADPEKCGGCLIEAGKLGGRLSV